MHRCHRSARFSQYMSMPIIYFGMQSQQYVIETSIEIINGTLRFRIWSIMRTKHPNRCSKCQTIVLHGDDLEQLSSLYKLGGLEAVQYQLKEQGFTVYA